MQGDLFALGTVIPQPDIRDVFGGFRVVSLSFALLLKLIPEAALGSLQAFGDISD